MPRVKGATNAIKNRKKTLKRAKGFRHAGSKKERAANEKLAHAGSHAYRHRREKKNDFRRLWTTQINAALTKHDLSYSKFMHAMKKAEITIDRKVLAALANNEPEAFDEVVKTVTS